MSRRKVNRVALFSPSTADRRSESNVNVVMATGVRGKQLKMSAFANQFYSCTGGCHIEFELPGVTFGVLTALCKLGWIVLFSALGQIELNRKKAKKRKKKERQVAAGNRDRLKRACVINTAVG